MMLKGWFAGKTHALFSRCCIKFQRKYFFNFVFLRRIRIRCNYHLLHLQKWLVLYKNWFEFTEDCQRVVRGLQENCQGNVLIIAKTMTETALNNLFFLNICWKKKRSCIQLVLYAESTQTTSRKFWIVKNLYQTSELIIGVCKDFTLLAQFIEIKWKVKIKSNIEHASYASLY